MKRHFVLVVFALSLVGCASVPLAPEDSDMRAKQFKPPEGMASIYVTRKHFYGHAYLFRLVLDGELIGQIAYKTYHKLDVLPGNHIITVMTEGKQSREKVKVNAGDVVFFDLVPGGFWTVTADIQKIDEEEGINIVSNSQLINEL